MEQILENLCEEAGQIGVFLPLTPGTDAISQPAVLHDYQLKNSAAVMISPCYDADENGAPTAQTIARYCDAARKTECGMLWSEPIAVSPDARTDTHQLMLTEENTEAFQALCAAVKEASDGAVLIALLDHAGRKAIKGKAFENSTLFSRCEILDDSEITPIAANCAIAAKTAEAAGFEGIALNVCERNLFADSLAAFHRNGKFGGDFDDRTRFVRDCFTAMKLTTSNAFLTIRLCLSDGLPQPDGFGMAFEDASAPDLSEPVLLLQILQALYGLKLVACEIGLNDHNWCCREEPESELIRVSRLCTCIGMLDSAMQQNVQLLIPDRTTEIPFANLAAGMISGEFASFAGFVQ